MTDTKEHHEGFPKESSYITKELLQKAIQLKEGDDQITVQHFQIGQECLKGENYGSVPFSVKVRFKAKSKECECHLFIKIVFDNELKRDWLLAQWKAFLKEGMTYATLIPDMIKCQSDRGTIPILPSVPTYYHSICDNSTGIILLENVHSEGYVIADRRSALDYSHCNLVMKEIAVFHALSFVLKNKNKENLKKYKFLFHEGFITESLPEFLIKGFGASMQMALNITDDDKIKNAVSKLRRVNLSKIMVDFIKPKEPYSLVCHGDFWSNNMLFKYENDTNHATPIGIKLIDFQIVRYALHSKKKS